MHKKVSLGFKVNKDCLGNTTQVLGKTYLGMLELSYRFQTYHDYSFSNQIPFKK